MFSKNNLVFSFLIGGALITAVIFYAQYSSNKVYKENLSLLKVGDNAKNYSTQAHLWLEELLAGDISINYEKDIVTLFAKAQESIDKCIIATNESNSLAEITPLLQGASKQMEILKKIAKQRVEIKLAKEDINIDSTNSDSSMDYTAGENLDVIFDQAYSNLQTNLNDITDKVDLLINERTNRYKTISQIALSILALFIGSGCFVLYKVLGRNEDATQDALMSFEEEKQRTNLLKNFLEGISKGEYEVSIVDDKNVELTQKLNLIRDQLKLNAIIEKHRNWSIIGLAQIGNILRSSNSSIVQLYDNIIRFVIKYTESNQGGLFIFNEENESDSHLELVACYAFERKKFLSKKIGIGEGLVGQCFVEGERIYLLDVPEEYITITSGLGGANPSALLLVPLKVNEKLYGVIEIASFKKYEDYEIELVEKLAESIASTIATVRTNESTRILLEKTQQQTEEMRAQEEEMRQNMEELEATQEEMRRKEKHLQDLLEQERAKSDAK